MLRYSFLTALFLIGLHAIAQKAITLEDIFLKNTFGESSVRGLNWMKDGQYYTAQENGYIIRYAVQSGQPLDTLFAAVDDFEFSGYSFSEDEKQILLMTDREPIYRRSFTAEYHVYDMASGSLRLLSHNGPQSYATFSPDGKKIAFVRENNLYVTDLESEEEKALTTDGEFNSIINGTTDWVYEEEFYVVKGFEWAPDSKKIAYYRFDETNVPTYNMQLWESETPYPLDYEFKYPKAGEANSRVSVFIRSLADPQPVRIDIPDDRDAYIPRIQWTRDPNLLSLIKMNRLQNELEIHHVDAQSGQSKVILKEKDARFIDLNFCDDLTYLKDGKHFIFSSERTGYKHFYLYRMDGTLVNPITSGPWEAVSLAGLDQSQKNMVLYYISTERSSMERHLYAIRLNGKNKALMTPEAGTYRVDMSPDCKYYMRYHSAADKPQNVSLYGTRKNNLIKVMKDNDHLIEKTREYGFVTKEFITIPAADGTPLNAYFLKPEGNGPFPLLVFQYSGPGSQQVSHAWGGGPNYSFHQMMVQKGFAVVVVDSRGTGGRGADFKKQTYKQLGALEAEDLIAAGRHMGAREDINAEAMGIWGWSYGGFMSIYALLEGSDVFAFAVSVAPVTDWRFYDTIYTERYMQRPQDNPEGYTNTSLITKAGSLEGRLLLIHGSGDDNVHIQNTYSLQDALIESGKQFRTFIYPDRNHGIGGGKIRLHVFEMISDFILEQK